jgi:hypothetical protein
MDVLINYQCIWILLSACTVFSISEHLNSVVKRLPYECFVQVLHGAGMLICDENKLPYVLIV